MKGTAACGDNGVQLLTVSEGLVPKTQNSSQQSEASGKLPF